MEVMEVAADEVAVVGAVGVEEDTDAEVVGVMEDGGVEVEVGDGGGEAGVDGVIQGGGTIPCTMSMFHTKLTAIRATVSIVIRVRWISPEAMKTVKGKLRLNFWPVWIHRVLECVYKYTSFSQTYIYERI